MGYEAYLLVPLRKNLKYIGLLWYVYFFKANTNLTFQKPDGAQFYDDGAGYGTNQSLSCQKGIDPGDCFHPETKPVFHPIEPPQMVTVDACGGGKLG
jgi:hypothetical protein